MYPVLLEIGRFKLPSYGVVYLIAFLVGITVLAQYIARVSGRSFGEMFDVAFQTAIAGEIGAHLTFVVVEWERVFGGQVSWWRLVLSGRVVLGGIITGILFLAWRVHRLRLPAVACLDGGGVGVALAMAIGRIGCLLSGCCYGAPTDAAWGIVFRDPQAAAWNGTPLHVPLHPTQILLFVVSLAVYFFLRFNFERRRFVGETISWFLLLQGLTRFAIEFLRDDPRGTSLGLATSQWIGLAMAAYGVAWLVRGKTGRCGSI